MISTKEFPNTKILGNYPIFSEFLKKLIGHKNNNQEALASI
jgi:hypothetical protein